MNRSVKVVKNVLKTEVSNRSISMFLIYSPYDSNVYGSRGEEFEG